MAKKKNPEGTGATGGSPDPNWNENEWKIYNTWRVANGYGAITSPFHKGKGNWVVVVVVLGLALLALKYCAPEAHSAVGPYLHGLQPKAG